MNKFKYKQFTNFDKMRKLKSLLIISVFLIFLPISSFSQIFTIGPTISWNFGNKQCKVSGGLEFGIIGIPIKYNEYSGGVLSLELGLDFEKNRNRFYTEIRFTQYAANKMGLPILFGISAGPVLEWGKDCKTAIGIQSSAYGWLILGANFRYRYVNGKSNYGPGMFLKLPFTFMRIDPGG